MNKEKNTNFIMADFHIGKVSDLFHAEIIAETVTSLNHQKPNHARNFGRTYTDDSLLLSRSRGTLAGFAIVAIKKDL